MRIGRSSTRCGREAPDLHLRLHVDPAELRDGRRARVPRSSTPTRVTTTSTTSASTSTTRVEMPSDIGVASGDHCGWKDPARSSRRTNDLRSKPRARSPPRTGSPSRFLNGVCRVAVAATKPSKRQQCGGDNPVFIEKMHGWMASLPATGARFARISRLLRGQSGPRRPATRSPSSPRRALAGFHALVRFIVRCWRE